MSKWSDTDPTRVRRAAIVGKYTDVSALDYLQGQSRADDGRDPAATVATDGGRERPDSCTCADTLDDEKPCFACFVAGFDDPADTPEAAPDGGGLATDELRIYDADDRGRPKVERRRVRRESSTTEATYDQLPSECAALVDGHRRPVADLSPEERAWVDAHTDGDGPRSPSGVTMRDRETGDTVTAETTAAVEQRAVEMWRAEQ